MGYLKPSPSQGPTSGRNGYITPAFWVVWNKEGIIRIGCLTPAFSGAHMWAQKQCNHCILGGPQQRGENQIGPSSGRSYLVPPAFSAVPNKGDIRFGDLNLAFPGAHKGAKLLRISCILGRPEQRGQNQSSLPHTFAFLWAHKLAELLGPLCILSRPQQRGSNQNWLPHTVAFLGAHNWAEMLRDAFSRAHMWAEMLHHPYVLRGPQQGGQLQICLLHPCLLKCRQVGQIAT